MSSPPTLPFLSATPVDLHFTSISHWVGQSFNASLASRLGNFSVASRRQNSCGQCYIGTLFRLPLLVTCSTFYHNESESDEVSSVATFTTFHRLKQTPHNSLHHCPNATVHKLFSTIISCTHKLRGFGCPPDVLYPKNSKFGFC